MSTDTINEATPNKSTEMNLRVYNTLTRQKEPFETVKPNKVGMYLCGPTVYAEAHIGHMVGPVIFDCVKRYLVYCGYDVKLVVNITDVDDKLIAKANERGISMAEVAAENTADYMHNLEAFGVDQIDIMPKATDHITHICDFIAKLIERDYAYASDGDVYFDVTKDADYGKLTNRTADTAQGEGGAAASKKRSASDFALWKASKPGEPAWDSPWGSGRPGWHIECSAMSRAILGETFDIHGGGLDLVFPHHENEMAQSESCHDKPMAKYWMHNGLMRASNAAGKVGGRSRDAQEEAAEQADVNSKISRSKGGGGLAKLIEAQGGERLRFFLLRTHYRSTIVFGDEGLAEAGVALDTFYRFFERYERVTGESFYDLQAPASRTATRADVGDDPLLIEANERREAFVTKMDDDFNTGAAMGDLFDLVRAINKFVDQYKLEENKTADEVATLKAGTVTLKELANVLGIFRTAPQKSADGATGMVDKIVPLLINIRANAREKKDFATSDKIRDEVTGLGVTLEDRSGETGFRVESGVDGSTLVDNLMQLVIQIRATARENKDFGTSDMIRDELAKASITLEDRSGETSWRQE